MANIPPTNRRPDAHTVRRLAVESCSDPRSVMKYLNGGRVRSVVAARITAALERLGLRDLHRGASPR